MEAGAPSAEAPRSRPTSTSLSAQFSGVELTKYRMLFNGARAGDVGLVRGLLADGMDVNLSGPRGATPLHIAARFGQLQMVELLLAHGANRDACDERGSSPADKARAVGKTSIALRLAQPPTPAPKHFDPACRRLLEAAHQGDPAWLFQIVTDEPMSVHMRGPRGASALHVAARYGHADAIALLLKFGASPHAVDDSGNTPIDKARQLKHKVMAPILLHNLQIWPPAVLPSFLRRFIPRRFPPRLTRTKRPPHRYRRPCRLSSSGPRLAIISPRSGPPHQVPQRPTSQRRAPQRRARSSRRLRPRRRARRCRRTRRRPPALSPPQPAPSLGLSRSRRRPSMALSRPGRGRRMGRPMRR